CARIKYDAQRQEHFAPVFVSTHSSGRTSPMQPSSWLGRTLLGVLLCAASEAQIRTFTTLLPPNPLPAGVAPNGSGRAEIRLDIAVRERFKLDIEDVAVNGNVADPTFGTGFYEAVLSSIDPVTGAETEQALPAFAGFLVRLVVPGLINGPTTGSLDFDARLDRNQTAIDPRGKMLRI